jgi:hypothetical protein
LSKDQAKAALRINAISREQFEALVMQATYFP